MVLLTISPTILEALDEARHLQQPADGDEPRDKGATEQQASKVTEDDGKGSRTEDAKNMGPRQVDSTNKATLGTQVSPGADSALGSKEPALSNPKLGDPISHGQILDLWKEMKDCSSSPKTLESLLRGARVYIPPPKTKPEPTSEYKALMARLRREEEERSYHRMTNPPPPMETFAQRFPLSSAAHAFASSQQPTSTSDEDEVTYADVDRQMALIFNVLISIVACAAAIWIAARWWPTPARLTISLAGSLLVGVAEVVVYSGYIRRVGEAKKKEKGVKEVKEVFRTWVIGAKEDREGDAAKEPIAVYGSAENTGSSSTRKRRKDTKKGI